MLFVAVRLRNARLAGRAKLPELSFQYHVSYCVCLAFRCRSSMNSVCNIRKQLGSVIWGILASALRAAESSAAAISYLASDGLDR